MRTIALDSLICMANQVAAAGQRKPDTYMDDYTIRLEVGGNSYSVPTFQQRLGRP